MTLQDGFGILNSITINTTVFNIEWILSTALIFLTLLIITRDINKWKILAFPTTVMWHIIGIKPSFLMYAITAILFVIEALSLEIIGNLVEGVKGMVKGDKNAFDKAITKTRVKMFEKEIGKTYDRIDGSKGSFYTNKEIKMLKKRLRKGR